MDSITITDLELHTRIGVPEEERATEQRVLASVSFPVDAAAVSKNDDLASSVDYFQVVQRIKELAKTMPTSRQAERKTIERLAEDIAQTLLRDFSLPSVRVTVKKFPFPGVKEVGISIERSR